MAVYSDLYDVEVRYAKDVSLSFRGLTEEEAYSIRDIVAVGRPATVTGDFSFDLILPDKVLYVHAYRRRTACPDCKTYYEANKGCTRPEYHE